MGSRGSMVCLLLALFLWTAQALEMQLDQANDNRQRCAGMYSKNTWGGPVDPFILVNFPQSLNAAAETEADPIVSLVIFEWNDEDFVGVRPTPESLQKIGICEQQYVDAGYCDQTDIGKFILAPNATEKSGNLILTRAVNLKDAQPINYPIKKTGYYCVLTDRFSVDDYTAIVEFRNAFGELPAAQIPKLPFYGGITILYAVVAVFWGFLYYQHHSDILAVQNYITAILLFLVVEMLMTWGFYDYMNRNGANVGSRVLLVVVGVLNAARNSFSFFLLLIVCMGYGVVKPTLGRTMIWVRWLAIAHFVFGLVYAITSLLIAPDAAGPFVLLIVFPLAATLTAFYIWTLNSLNWTLKDLRERRQHAKQAMYKKLWWAILLSIMVTFAFFFFNSFSFASVSDPDFVPFHWKSRWFILDGWLNLVYFADVALVAYIWRPTTNNRRFAMSDEIAQDDDGNFEIGDLGVPDDDDDDNEEEEEAIGRGPKAAGSQAVPQFAPPAGPPPASVSSRSAAPVPRDSLDDETIFAVGEDGDKFSDDEGSGEEFGLVRGSKR